MKISARRRIRASMLDGCRRWAERGSTVVAAVRDGDGIASLDPDEFVFRDDAPLVIVGTNGGNRRFEERVLR